MARPDVAQTLPDVMQVRSGQASHPQLRLARERKDEAKDDVLRQSLWAVAESGLFAGAWGL